MNVQCCDAVCTGGAGINNVLVNASLCLHIEICTIYEDKCTYTSSWYVDNKLKKEKSEGLKSLKTSVTDWANRKDFSLELKTKAMKARDKNTVTKTFHAAGLVVPVDPETEVGYRELPDTPGKERK